MSKNERKTQPRLPAAAQPERSGVAAAAQDESVAGQAVQAGAMLRQMRQSANVDPMLLASALKVGLQKIQALEDGRLDDLPGLTFARGLAAAICRYFAADPGPVLALMPRVLPGLPDGIERPHEPFKPSTFHAGSSDDLNAPRQRAGVPGWLLAVVAVLLIGTLVVWLMPEQRLNAPRLQAAKDTEQTVAAAASEPVAAPASMPEPEAAPAEPAAAEPAASAPPQAGQPGSDTPDQDVIAFNATGRVWVGVRDASGEPVLSRLLTKGDTVSVGGELPLSVTVGDKTAVTVTVRGQPFDLSQYARRGTVARFTVGPADSSP